MLGKSWDNIVIPKQNSMRIQLDHSLDRVKRIMKIWDLILGDRFGENHIVILFYVLFLCVYMCMCL